MEMDLNSIDVRKEEALFIRDAYLFHEGLVMIEKGGLKWIEPPFQDKKKRMSIFRRSCRLFATSKILGSAFRVTKNLWCDYLSQLKRIWIKGQGNEKES